MEFLGRSFIAGTRISRGDAVFFGTSASTGERLEPAFTGASMQDVHDAASAASAAFPVFSKTSARVRARFLKAIASRLEKLGPELVSRAMAETALPQARLEGELARTCGQLRLFATMVEDGSWQHARIDRALPERKPLPRPDLRSVLSPLGPVAVFGASNFPLAFSVAGGDTASALAAGNPVVVKAHPAHPGTSELAAFAITHAVAECELPPGVFSMLFDDGIAAAQQLVQHPAIEAVAFTGSHRAGRALMDLCAARPRPIPCFTEMSSLNPVFILPGALAGDPRGGARGLHGSFTLGAGQFCTKPGLVFLPETDGVDAFREELRTLSSANAPFTMLTPGIANAYHRGLEDRRKLDLDTVAASVSASPQSHAVLHEASLETFQKQSALHEELFGPTTLLISWRNRERMLQAAEALEGHLTATLLGDEADLAVYADLIAILERKVGRLLVNGFPTGVEVSHAMVHGGPYPATSDSRFTSVGSQAIYRFVRPVCYQNFPQAALPEALRDENALNIMRLVDGVLTREPL